jgi:predicted AAA+ superfamily ATPase
VSQYLVPAREIILIGHGTGKSSAVDALTAYLKKHRPDVAGRVIATDTADLSALTEPGIEAIAKQHMGAKARD